MKKTIQATSKDYFLFFIQKFLKVLFPYFIILFGIVYLVAIFYGEMVQKFLTERTVVEWLLILFVVPLIIAMKQTRELPQTFELESGWLEVKNGKKVERFNISLYYIRIIPRTYKSEFLSLMGTKQEIIFILNGKQTVVDCRLISRKDFETICSVLQDDHRRKSAPTKMNVAKKKLDNVLFVSRPEPYVFEDTYNKKKQMHSIIFFSCILVMTIVIATFTFPNLTYDLIKYLGLLLIFLLGVILFGKILYCVYDNQIPANTLLGIEMTERVIILKMQGRIEIFRTEFISNVYITPVDTESKEGMREIILVTADDNDFEFVYSYGRQNNMQVVKLYENFVEQLTKIFKSKVNYIEE